MQNTQDMLLNKIEQLERTILNLKKIIKINSVFDIDYFNELEYLEEKNDYLDTVNLEKNISGEKTIFTICSNSNISTESIQLIFNYYLNNSLNLNCIDTNGDNPINYICSNPNVNFQTIQFIFEFYHKNNLNFVGTDFCNNNPIIKICSNVNFNLPMLKFIFEFCAENKLNFIAIDNNIRRNLNNPNDSENIPLITIYFYFKLIVENPNLNANMIEYIFETFVNKFNLDITNLTCIGVSEINKKKIKQNEIFELEYLIFANSNLNCEIVDYMFKYFAFKYKNFFSNDFHHEWIFKLMINNSSVEFIAIKYVLNFYVKHDINLHFLFNSIESIEKPIDSLIKMSSLDSEKIIYILQFCIDNNYDLDFEFELTNYKYQKSSDIFFMHCNPYDTKTIHSVLQFYFNNKIPIYRQRIKNIMSKRNFDGYNYYVDKWIDDVIKPNKFNKFNKSNKSKKTDSDKNFSFECIFSTFNLYSKTTNKLTKNKSNNSNESNNPNELNLLITQNQSEKNN